MWLLLDEHDEANDKRLAAHIIAVHQGRVGAPAAAPAAANANGNAAGAQAGSSRQQEGASTSGVSVCSCCHSLELGLTASMALPRFRALLPIVSFVAAVHVCQASDVILAVLVAELFIYAPKGQPRNQALLIFVDKYSVTNA